MKLFDENRRKIMSLIGAGAIGTVVSQLMPFKVFANKTADTKSEVENNEQKVTVKMHPLAVQRNKKG